LPFAVCRLPFAVCRLPFAVCRLPFAVCRLPFAAWRVPCAVCRVARNPSSLREFSLRQAFLPAAFCHLCLNPLSAPIARTLPAIPAFPTRQPPGSTCARHPGNGTCTACSQRSDPAQTHSSPFLAFSGARLCGISLLRFHPLWASGPFS
jgi:hypothetical protein